MNMLFSMMATLSFMFMFMNHPLSFGIMIIMQTLMVAWMIGLMISNMWFSYILIITMVSGMLVLFIYMSSVASNEKFKISMKMVLMSPIVMMLSYFMTPKVNVYNINNEMLTMTLNKLFNSSTLMITIIMIMYLFITMITVSYIVNIDEGPLRIKK